MYQSVPSWLRWFYDLRTYIFLPPTKYSIIQGGATLTKKVLWYNSLHYILRHLLLGVLIWPCWVIQLQCPTTKSNSDLICDIKPVLGHCNTLHHMSSNTFLCLLLEFAKIAEWVANIVYPDQTPLSAASDLGLHCLLRSVCPNIGLIQLYITLGYVRIRSGGVSPPAFATNTTLSVLKMKRLKKQRCFNV